MDLVSYNYEYICRKIVRSKHCHYKRLVPFSWHVWHPLPIHSICLN